MPDALEEIQEARPRRFRPYPEYKDSGVDWLGQIPAHWDTPRMWRVSRARSGGTPPKDERGYWEGEIPWVSPKDMKRRFIDSSEDSVTDRAVAETGIKLIAPPVMLVVVRGMILAHSFPVAITSVPVTINQDMKAIAFDAGIEPRFMAWVFEGVGKAVLAAIVEEAAHGTKAIRMDEWRSVKVPLPDAAEQGAIVAFLDRETAKIDALVARKDRLIELLQEERSTLITRAVTRGLDPYVPMKDSGVQRLGEIPAHWEVMPLGYLATIGNGSTPNRNEARYWVDGSYPWLTSAKINEEVIAAADEFVTDAALRECHLPRVPARSVLVAITGEGQTRGRTALLLIDSTISQHLAYITPARPELGMSYLRRFLESSYGWLRFESSGAGSTRAALTCEFLRSIKLTVPPSREQSDIAAYLDRETAKIDALVARVREAIDRLKEFRAALISAAVTGKIDVREEAT